MGDIPVSDPQKNKRMAAYLATTEASGGPVLEFKEAFDDPLVSLSQEKRTVEHDVISGATDDDEYVVQVMGEKPTEITITAIITQSQVETARELTSRDIITVHTTEWIGVAAPNSISIDPRREKHNGNWLYDVTYDVTETEEYLDSRYDEEA
ncbi:hypothetical protein [Halosegnis longus]|uniref:hypothetical protein n=1 Tax=Halosegnis longus TaxID=2216012 RepID=UPI00129D6C26|nr:hypothetical protein [Halosegnis longus]